MIGFLAEKIKDKSCSHSFLSMCLSHGPRVQTCPEIKLIPMGLAFANLQGHVPMGHRDQGQSIEMCGEKQYIMLEHRAKTLKRSSKIEATPMSSIR